MYTRRVVKKVAAKKVVRVVKTTKMIRVVEPAVVSKPTVALRQPGDKHVVKKGESLWKISQQHYGQGKSWPVVYRVNKRVIGKNPNKIYPGQTFSIPRQARYNSVHRMGLPQNKS